LDGTLGDGRPIDCARSEAEPEPFGYARG